MRKVQVGAGQVPTHRVKEPVAASGSYPAQRSHATAGRGEGAQLGVRGGELAGEAVQGRQARRRSR
ncbi:hypothetical protein [Streptomyces sp. 769]|uniref:hypothetical protein n=1 Tax=Streptomyces sp. 769 TaxID=1262452 RepID=UPI000A7AD927|nr:hypothetical protein [Streptomyces sp. 769]